MALAHEDITQRIIGAFFDAHHELAFGYLEAVYQEALAVLFEELALRAEREPALVVRFHGRSIGVFKPDFVVESLEIVEVKCAPSIQDGHRAQILDYLRACDKEIALLLNFGRKPTFERFVFANSRKRPDPSSTGPRRSASLRGPQSSSRQE